MLTKHEAIAKKIQEISHKIMKKCQRIAKMAATNATLAIMVASNQRKFNSQMAVNPPRTNSSLITMIFTSKIPFFPLVVACTPVRPSAVVQFASSR